MKKFLKKLTSKIVIYLKPFLNIKFLLCFGIAWLITNGWAYVFISLGTLFNMVWMKSIGAAYLAFLWLPFTPEKLITIPIAIFLQKLFFRHDNKVTKQLNEMRATARKDWNKVVATMKHSKKKTIEIENTLIHYLSKTKSNHAFIKEKTLYTYPSTSKVLSLKYSIEEIEKALKNSSRISYVLYNDIIVFKQKDNSNLIEFIDESNDEQKSLEIHLKK